jgi:ABC-type ATPase involved in cell division
MDERKTMRRLCRVEVEGLFGYANHIIDFRAEEPTILTGLNGVGKTHVLTLIRSALKLDLPAIAMIPFQKLEIEFLDGHGLVVERMLSIDAPIRLRILALRSGKPNGQPFETSADDWPDDHIPPQFVELPGDRWHDIRSDRIVSRQFLERRYGPAMENATSRFAKSAEILAVVEGVTSIFIDTKRLDSPTIYRNEQGSGTSRYELGFSGSASRFPPRPAASRIEQYIDQIRIQVVEARRASVAETQSADLSFAVRALAAAHDTIHVAQLRAKYNGIAEQYEDLTRNGLATGEVPVQFPNNTTPTIRRILNVFLDDWARRLRPLLPLNEKLTVLRRILDEKFAETGKSTHMTDQGRLAFRDRKKKIVRVPSLSSGEQHLVALYAMLVFGADPGALVLIDEPEISMHVAWKHAFLRDITEVATLSSLQIVLATHSTAIINGRWDLTEELLVNPEGGEVEEVDELDADSSVGGNDWLV